MKMRSLELSLWLSSGGVIVAGGVEDDDIVAGVLRLDCLGLTRAVRCFLDAMFK